MSTILIMRGLPGSGKSTKAQEIAELYKQETGKTVVIRSTDDQFMVKGEYKFDRSLIGVNHARNQKLVEQDMLDGVQLIIVDNTNIKRRDFKPYLDLAAKYGYTVTYNVVGSFDDEFVKMAHARNRHNVPLETIQRMADSFED